MTNVEKICRKDYANIKNGFSIQIDNFEWLNSPPDLISIEVAKFPQKKLPTEKERESVCVGAGAWVCDYDYEICDNSLSFSLLRVCMCVCVLCVCECLRVCVCVCVWVCVCVCVYVCVCLSVVTCATSHNCRSIGIMEETDSLFPSQCTRPQKFKFWHLHNLFSSHALTRIYTHTHTHTHTLTWLSFCLFDISRKLVVIKLSTLQMWASLIMITSY